MEEARQIDLEKAVAAEKTFYTPTLIAEIKKRIIPKSEVNAFLQDTLNANFPERAYISPKLLENWKLQEEFSKLEGPMDWSGILPEFFSFGKHMAHHRVSVLAGTDCGLFLVIPGLSLHEELDLLVEHFKGDNLKALQSATINPDAVGAEAAGSTMQTITGRKLLLQAGSATALHWAINSVKKGGIVSIVGVYGPTGNLIPIGNVVNKGITIRANQASVKRLLPKLIDHVQNGIP
ncbi:hypothetical protein BH23BAC1_BH23BAC1_51120 [soil metagenome]